MAKLTRAQEIAETGKLIFKAFTEPDTIFSTDSSRDHEVIVSSAECNTCGGEPMFRANGVQVRCPACREMPEPKAEIQRR